MSKSLFVLADILGAKWGSLLLFSVDPRGTQRACRSALKHQAF